MCLVGSDSNIRYWSIRTGDMLCCLNPGTHEMPHITYTDSLGGTHGKPSLVLTSNSSISVYQNAVWHDAICIIYVLSMSQWIHSSVYQNAVWHAIIILMNSFSVPKC